MGTRRPLELLPYGSTLKLQSHDMGASANVKSTCQRP